MNADAMYRFTLDHQRELLDEAERSRLARRGPAEHTRRTFGIHPWRATSAALLRRVADRLEPMAPQPQVRLLRR